MKSLNLTFHLKIIYKDITNDNIELFIYYFFNITVTQINILNLNHIIVALSSLTISHIFLINFLKMINHSYKILNL